MLAKLALRNVRRSARDYAVYFVTLLFGVAMFYAFNSIESQTVLLDIRNHASGHMLDLTISLLGIFSVVVALVLAFLVVYANRFIIKRRKREFGTYLLLGMSSSKVATILLVEMLAVGAVSLLVGLLAGMLMSQGLAFASAALMGTTMTKYRFVVSTSAIVKTLVCFAILFAATLVMNIRFVSRRKLGDLLTQRSDQKPRARASMVVRVIGLIAALGLLAFAYLLLGLNEFSQVDAMFALSTLTMMVGTVLLFLSSSSIVLALVQRAPGFYYRGLRAFTARQVSGKVGNASASLSVVCIMLFFALSTISVGFGLRSIFVGDIDKMTQYDATLACRFCNPVYPVLEETLEDSYANRRALMLEEAPDKLAAAEAANFDMAADLAARNPAWNDLVASSAQLDYYAEPQMKWASVLAEAGVDASSMESAEGFGISNVTVVSLSQFNATCELTGKPTYKLADNQYLVNNTIGLSDKVAHLMREQAAPITIAGIDLTASPDEVAVEMRTGVVSDVGLELVVPDAVIDAMKAQGALPTTSYLNCMYTCDREQGEDQLKQVLKEAYSGETASEEDGYMVPGSLWPYRTIYTAEYMTAQVGGMKLLITYLALYIGFVMLVSTAAILAIQQLSETADSVGRYQRLSSLGCDRDMILGSLRAQSVLYFVVPLAVALVHTAYVVIVMNRGIFSVFGINPMSGIVVTAALVMVVYGCYLEVTYRAARNVVCEACGF